MTAARVPPGHGLLANSVAIAVASNLTAGLGYLFWTMCARAVTPSEIGMTATVVSAMLLVSLLAAGGFVPLLIRKVSAADAEELSGLSSTAFVLAAGLAGAGGAMACLLLPGSVRAALGIPALVAIMAVGSAGAALLLLVSAVLVGVRRADSSLLGNVAASLSRLAGVAGLLGLGVLSAGAAVNMRIILLVWLVSFAVAFAVSVRLVVRAVPGFRFHPGRAWLPRLVTGVGWEHLATLSAQIPVFVLPILAAKRLPADQVGYLYITLMVGWAFFAVAAAVSTALLADCADRPERLQSQVQRSIALAVVTLVVPVAVTCMFAPQLLSLFGPGYGRYGSTLLIVLVVSAFPNAVNSVAISALRIQRQLPEAATLNLSMAITYLAGSWIALPYLGIAGAGWAHLASECLGTATVLLVVGYRRFTGTVRRGDQLIRSAGR
jgi:O-antigen/teichoic acid export membrane protein